MTVVSNRQTEALASVAFFFSLNVVITHILNTLEENLTMDIESVVIFASVIFFLATAQNVTNCGQI